MTDLSLPPELMESLNSITSESGATHSAQPSLLQSAIDWQKEQRHTLPLQVIPYEVSKLIFIDYWKRQLTNGETFGINPKNALIIPDLLKWAINDPSSSIPLHKSIWLYGLVGSGKSVFAQALSDFLNWLNGSVPRSQGWNYVDMDLLMAKAQFDTMELSVLNGKRNFIIDELKESQQKVRLMYGMEFKIGSLISTRYSMWKDQGFRILVTTNLPPDPGKAPNVIFDDREWDRMLEMFKSIKWEGASMRPNKK